LAVEEGQLELNFAVLWRQCASPEADVWIFDAIARFLESRNFIKSAVDWVTSRSSPLRFQQATQKYGCSRSIVISIGRWTLRMRYIPPRSLSQMLPQVQVRDEALAHVKFLSE
jgi:hypothetical protein